MDQRALEHNAAVLNTCRARLESIAEQGGVESALAEAVQDVVGVVHALIMERLAANEYAATVAELVKQREEGRPLFPAGSRAGLPDEQIKIG